MPRRDKPSMPHDHEKKQTVIVLSVVCDHKPCAEHRVFLRVCTVSRGFCSPQVYAGAL